MDSHPAFNIFHTGLRVLGAGFVRTKRLNRVEDMTDNPGEHTIMKSIINNRAQLSAHSGVQNQWNLSSGAIAVLSF